MTQCETVFEEQLWINSDANSHLVSGNIHKCQHTHPPYPPPHT